MVVKRTSAAVSSRRLRSLKPGVAVAAGALPAIFQGLQTTVKHMFLPKVTVQFPEQRPTMPPNYRGVHRLNRDDKATAKTVTVVVNLVAELARGVRGARRVAAE